MAKKYITYSSSVYGSVRSKYRRKSHHHKKSKNQEKKNKEAWRQERQVLRDKAKRLGVVKGCFSDGVPPWLKRKCNKAHRRWEKACIKGSKFDELSGLGKRRDLFNPWVWF